MTVKKFEDFLNDQIQDELNIPIVESKDDNEDENEDELEDSDNEEDDDIDADYEKYDDLLQGKTKDSRKIANNTYVIRVHDGIAIRLYATDIITFQTSGDFRLNTGGFATVTTFSRINEYIPQGYRVAKIKGQWFLHTPTKTVGFEDNMVIKRRP